jgi:hypothetical protein
MSPVTTETLHREITPRPRTLASYILQASYLHAVTKFSGHFGRSPDRLGLEDVRAFQVYLVSQGISWPTLDQTVCALRFFYVTCSPKFLHS